MSNSNRQLHQQVFTEIKSCLYKLDKKCNQHHVATGIVFLLAPHIEKMNFPDSASEQEKRVSELSAIFDFIHELHTVPVEKLFYSARPPFFEAEEKDKTDVIGCFVEKSVKSRLDKIKALS